VQKQKYEGRNQRQQSKLKEYFVAHLKTPTVLAICGEKDSGKTTLITRLLPLLKDAGLTVAVFKHHRHGSPLDTPGTDTWRFLKSGAVGAVLSGEDGFMLVKRFDGNEDAFFRLFPEADLILLEGYKHSAWAKIEIRTDPNRTVCKSASLLAIVCDQPVRNASLPVFSRNDCREIADFILAHWALLCRV
jgi:molybdopterin-guanine dinucleotide biosynthesis protein B